MSAQPSERLKFPCLWHRRQQRRCIRRLLSAPFAAISCFVAAVSVTDCHQDGRQPCGTASSLRCGRHWAGNRNFYRQSDAVSVTRSSPVAAQGQILPVYIRGIELYNGRLTLLCFGKPLPQEKPRIREHAGFGDACVPQRCGHRLNHLKQRTRASGCFVCSVGCLL